MDPKSRQDLWRAVGVAANAGITLFVCILLGLWFGNILDEWFLWKIPWGMLFGGFLGAFAGFWGVFKQIVNK